MDVEVTDSTSEQTSASVPTQEGEDVNPLKWCVWSVILVAGLVGLCLGLLKLGPMGVGGSGLDLDPNRQPDLAQGKMIYTRACATCHGPGGHGLPHQGAPLSTSNFVHTGTDVQIIKMVKMGRTPSDPKSVMQLPMPAKGGYTSLSDAELHDVVAYVRTLGTTKLTQAGLP